jgi:opacity protein-like surface antigen
MQFIAKVAAAVVAVGTSVIVYPFSVAQAADLGVPRESAAREIDQPQVVYQPQSAAHRQFYVRGDVGVGRHSFGKFSQADLTANDGDFLSKSVGDTVYVGAGLGWQVNSRFRFDLTGEYRSTAQVKALANLSGDIVDAGVPLGTLQANSHFQANMTAVVGLLNGYWDIANYRGFTPYVGAGLGFANVRLSDLTAINQATFTDTGTGDVVLQQSSGYSKAHSQTNFAWALMAGTSYDLSPNAKLDLGYRYLNMGSGTSASTGLLDCTCGTIGQPLKIADIDAHEFRVGVRWMLGGEQAPSPVAYQPLK